MGPDAVSFAIAPDPGDGTLLGVIDRASVASALEAGLRFWTLLADDDDAALVEMLTPEAHAAYVATFPEMTLAAAIRDHSHASVDQCRHMGVASEFDILARGRLRLVFSLAGQLRRSYQAGEEMIAWRLLLVPDGDTWRVDPRRWDPPEERIAWASWKDDRQELPTADDDTAVH